MDFEDSDFEDSGFSQQQIDSALFQDLQEKRAKAVFQELTEGLPDLPLSFDDEDMATGQKEFDAHIKKLNELVANNLDSDSLWEFVFLAGDLQERCRVAEIAATTIKRARNGKRLPGATTRAKIAKEERGKLEAERKSMLSMAGMNGAMARRNRYEPIKQWALGKAGNMRGSHKQIARQLSAVLPPHLTGVSDDPERLIYDTLRASKKP